MYTAQVSTRMSSINLRIRIPYYIEPGFNAQVPTCKNASILNVTVPSTPPTESHPLTYREYHGQIALHHNGTTSNNVPIHQPHTTTPPHTRLFTTPPATHHNTPHGHHIIPVLNPILHPQAPTSTNTAHLHGPSYKHYRTPSHPWTTPHPPSKTASRP